MDIENKNIWQIAAGDTKRSYARVFLDWDIMAMGPGYAGAWPECKETLYNDKWKTRKIRNIEKFYRDIAPNDLVVLREGTQKIFGVGIVRDDKTYWYDDFGDIDGWDLQHVRRVKWIINYLDKGKPQDQYKLNRGLTLQKVTNNKLIDWLKDVNVATKILKKPIKSLPKTCIDNQPATQIDIENIGNYLFERGIASGNIQNLLSLIDELIRIAKWYGSSGTKTSEFETIAYLTLPLLKALGWTPQRMAIEWNKIDIALFDQLPRDGNNLSVAVEVKRRGESCLSALSQARNYVSAKGSTKCRRLIVTDGIRYGVFIRKPNGSFSNYPDAYLNLTRLMNSYSIIRSKGAEESLLLMSADWRG